MPHTTQNSVPNTLIDSLPDDDKAYLLSISRLVTPPAGRILTSRASPGHEIWFPHTGVVALTATDAAGRSVQTGVVGREGCIGLEALFGPVTLPDAVVQIEGSMSLVAANDLRSALAARPAIQMALSRFLFGLSAQSLQTVACNRLHSLVSRCCRWLLMMQDRVEADVLPITQENLATLLGSGRPRVTTLLARLERKGFVRRHRGQIHLLTRSGLETCTCDCYHAAQT